MKIHKLYLGGIALVAATMLANVFNFLFNIYLGRNLSLKDFGELTLFTSLLYLVSIPLGAFSAATAHSIAKLYGKYDKNHAYGYFRHILSKTIIYGIVFTALWFAATPFLTSFFHLDSSALMLYFAPLWLISVISANYSGYLKGILAFGAIAILAVVESASRLLFGFMLVGLGLERYVALAIVLSFGVTAFTGWRLSRGAGWVHLRRADTRFNTVFFLISALTGVSLISFLTLDVVLVKHYLSAVEAGAYGLLSLIGKMTYFLGSLMGPFMIPIVSHNEGAKKDSKREFLFLFLLTLLFCVGSFVGLGVYGELFLPAVFGDKIYAVIPYLTPYILAMALFTITQPVVAYFQAKENYSYTVVGFVVSLFQIILTVLFHENLDQIVWIMVMTGAANLALMIVLYALGDKLDPAYAKLNVFKKFKYAA